MRLLRRINVQTRLLIALLGMSVVPAVLIGMYAYHSSRNLLTEKLATSAEETIRLLDSNMTAELARYSLFIDAVSASEKIQAALSNAVDDAELASAIESIVFHGGYFKNLYVASKDGKKLYGAGYTQIREADLAELIKSVEASSSKGRPARDSLTRAGCLQQGKLALGRKIFRFPEGQEHIGYIFTFINDSNIYEMYEEKSFGGGKMALLSADGMVLTGSMAAASTDISTSEVFTKMKQALAKGKGSYFAEVADVPSLVVYSHNPRYETYMAATIPLSYLNDDAGQAGRSIALWTALSAALCVTVSLWIYRSVERRKRELELEALQYQINPHFLFNTLDTLKWIAVINDAPSDISRGISSLTKLLQGVVLSKEAMIPLREELDNLANYFTIQKIRYADCFQVVQDIEAVALDGKVPRFILQPLAENAVLHGSEGGKRKIVITISGRSYDEGILLEVADNGSGFDPLNETSKFSGIGISNVNERLKLHYGSRHGLKIDSAVGKGTVCTVWIPKLAD
jgi:two-component system sensor histidine kinase YesM